MAYGLVADGDELLTVFRCDFQREGEKASEYLLRLHTLLTRVVEEGGAAQEECPRLLCSQFQRGCLFNDNLLHTLQLSSRKANPPQILELLREVRVAESQLEDKLDRKAAHRSPQKKVSVLAIEQTVQAPTPASKSTGEVEELRQAVDRLHRRLDGIFKSTPRAQQGNPSYSGNRQRSQSFFCYNCGEEGHRSSICKSPKNPALVQEKMLTRATASKPQSSGNDSGQQ
ncbi:paraneoplastic antigen Ma3-like [Asterias rubens]|uniref:paraneoplastic antigen Ma3-like n=1 Tax=Asterias rubens TaxID=7604 RepID=UPI001454F1E0|nr:paraneoplastic antigen Ma3-like [Asterias rubens]